MNEGHEFTTTQRTHLPPTPETVNAARRTVAGHAIDAADCRELLDMLELPHEDVTE